MSRNKEAIIAILLEKEAGLDTTVARDQAAGLVGANPTMVIADDFGHAAINVGGTHIDSWGAGPFKITVGDEAFEFEDSDRFGSVHCENGEPSGYQFMQESKFWSAWQAWKDQGRRIADDGVTCVWEDCNVSA